METHTGETLKKATSQEALRTMAGPLVDYACGISACDAEAELTSHILDRHSTAETYAQPSVPSEL